MSPVRAGRSPFPVRSPPGDTAGAAAACALGAAVRCAGPRSACRTGRGAQSGVVLILGLVILLVITLIGVTGIETTVMQERMAGNLRQNDIALQSAEAALQAGLAYIEAQRSPPIADPGGTEYVWPACTVVEANAGAASAACAGPDDVVRNWQGELAAVDAGATYESVAGALGGSDNLPGGVAQPRLRIEVRYLPPLDVEQAARGAGVHYYTVTAVGFGGTDSARAIVQSTVAKVFQY